jgi:hypothetical protein
VISPKSRAPKKIPALRNLVGSERPESREVEAMRSVGSTCAIRLYPCATIQQKWRLPKSTTRFQKHKIRGFWVNNFCGRHGGGKIASNRQNEEVTPHEIAFNLRARQQNNAQ